MPLMLRYTGPLPTGNAESSKAIKNRIRRYLHPQLLNFAKGDYHFNYLATPGNQPPLAGVRFAPLAIEGVSAEVRIEILRREPPGQIITNGGDLDGRLKTLFDGLRLPKDAGETHGFTPEWGDYCICLLQDDAQIRKVIIDTREWLEPAADASKKTDVEIRMDVDFFRGTI